MLRAPFWTGVHTGQVKHVVHEAAVKDQADLVLIGRGVMQEGLGQLRSGAYEVIRDSPCPVISVRPLPIGLAIVGMDHVQENSESEHMTIFVAGLGFVLPSQL
jgi:hypothetical protein